MTEEQKYLAKLERYKTWYEGLRKLAARCNDTPSRFIRVLESDWQDVVYGWDEAPEFIYKLKHGDFPK